MKILHLITSLRTGGAEKLMVDLLPRLRGKGVEVDLCLHDGLETPFRKDLESKGIKVFDLGIGGSVYSPAKFLKLLPCLKNYDIIHTHNTASQFFGALGTSLTPIKAVTTEHNTTNRRRGNRLFKILDKWMYGRYKRIICISDKTDTQLVEYLPKLKKKSSVISNGIDLGVFDPNKLKKYLEKNDNIRTIIQVAGFRDQKDQDTTIKALKYLPEYFHLNLVGDGIRRQELEKLVNKLQLEERVHFLGIRTDVPELIHNVDYVVMSSHWEGFGLSAVEGMAAKKPVLATNVDGLREVVEGAGILFEHENAEELAQKILELEQNPEKYSSVAGACKKRSQDFDISKMVDGYFEVYNNLMNQK